MKTKIVYCLVSDATDYYYEQLLISLCSLRKHNPKAEVEVVCDNGTFDTLIGNRRGIFDYDIHLIQIDTPKDWEKLERSRYLKTNLRRLTQGDYLYVDTDTVICTSLDFIDDLPIEIGAVHDSHLEYPLPNFSKCKYKSQRWIWSRARQRNINIEGYLHFNSGVMFVRDIPKAHELYKRWNENYQNQLKYGVKIDQLPLLLSNHEMNDIISPLDWRLNCQVPFEGIRNKVAQASIVHYFPGHNTTLLSSPWILDPIKESGYVNISIRRIIDEPDKFFDKLSDVVIGEPSNMLHTYPLVKMYTSCPTTFNIFVCMMKAYLFAKRKLQCLLHH